MKVVKAFTAKAFFFTSLFKVKNDASLAIIYEQF